MTNRERKSIGKIRIIIITKNRTIMIPLLTTTSIKEAIRDEIPSKATKKSIVTKWGISRTSKWASQSKNNIFFIMPTQQLCFQLHSILYDIYLLNKITTNLKLFFCDRWRGKSQTKYNLKKQQSFDVTNIKLFYFTLTTEHLFFMTALIKNTKPTSF